MSHKAAGPGTHTVVSRANIPVMPESSPAGPGETISDREILLHILRRVEGLWDELERYRPLLAMMRTPDGKPDMVGIFQARREAKRGARSGR